MRSVSAATVCAFALGASVARAQPCGSIEQVSVHLGDSPSTSLNFNWAATAACKPNPETARVEYGPSADNITQTAPGTQHQYTLDTYTSPYLFNASVVGLPLNAPVWYRVGDDSCGFSCAISTSPAIPAGGSGARLALFGDVGTTDNSVSTLSGVLAAHRLTPFTAGILLGDLSYADGVQPVWDEFGRMSSFLFQELPVQTLPGNHEWFDDAGYSFTAYMNRYSVPNHGDANDELFYSFNAGLFHVVMLAGYCPSMTTTKSQPCLASGSEQAVWLEADLAAVDRATTPWVVVAFHQPFVNSNTAHSIANEGVYIQEAVEDILYNAKVDVVFSGHVHAYERSCKSYKFKCVDDGPIYLTVGDGGNREGLASKWVTPCPEWSTYRQATYGFGELEALNATHARWVWHQNEDLTPGLIDEVYFEKGVPVTGTGECTTAEPELRNRMLSASQ